MKPYRVDFWDSFDRSWAGLGRDFDDLNEAIAKCNRMQQALPRSNKDCGEHYGVIDLRISREVYCANQDGEDTPCNQQLRRAPPVALLCVL
jgi:hypothetical protein